MWNRPTEKHHYNMLGLSTNSLQLCPMLCNHTDSSLPGFPVHGIFSGQEYWSGLLFPSPQDLRGPGFESMSPALQVDCLHWTPWEALTVIYSEAESLAETTSIAVTHSCLPTSVSLSSTLLPVCFTFLPVLHIVSISVNKTWCTCQPIDLNILKICLKCMPARVPQYVDKLENVRSRKCFFFS